MEKTKKKAFQSVWVARLLSFLLIFVTCFNMIVPSYAYTIVYIQCSIDLATWEIIAAPVRDSIGISSASNEIRRVEKDALETMKNNQTSATGNISLISGLTDSVASRNKSIANGGNFLAGLIQNVGFLEEDNRVLSFPTKQTRRDNSTSTDYNNALTAVNEISFDLNQAFALYCEDNNIKKEADASAMLTSIVAHRHGVTGSTSGDAYLNALSQMREIDMKLAETVEVDAGVVPGILLPVGAVEPVAVIIVPFAGLGPNDVVVVDQESAAAQGFALQGNALNVGLLLGSVVELKGRAILDVVHAIADTAHMGSGLNLNEMHIAGSNSFDGNIGVHGGHSQDCGAVQLAGHRVGLAVDTHRIGVQHQSTSAAAIRDVQLGYSVALAGSKGHSLGGAFADALMGYISGRVAVSGDIQVKILGLVTSQGSDVQVVDNLAGPDIDSAVGIGMDRKGLALNGSGARNGVHNLASAVRSAHTQVQLADFLAVVGGEGHLIDTAAGNSGLGAASHGAGAQAAAIVVLSISAAVGMSGVNNVFGLDRNIDGVVQRVLQLKVQGAGAILGGDDQKLIASAAGQGLANGLAEIGVGVSVRTVADGYRIHVRSADFVQNDVIGIDQGGRGIVRERDVHLAVGGKSRRAHTEHHDHNHEQGHRPHFDFRHANILLYNFSRMLLSGWADKCLAFYMQKLKKISNEINKRKNNAPESKFRGWVNQF